MNGASAPARLACAFLALALSHGPAQADGPASTARGVAHASVIEPATVRQLSTLHSGQLAAGQRTACRAPGGCRMAHPARFSLGGDPGRAFQVSVPGDYRFERAGRQNLDQPRLSAIDVRTGSRLWAQPIGRIGDSGTGSFGIGATLHMPAGLDAGASPSDFGVIVNYN